MTSVGYATLQIIPSMKGVGTSLEKGFAPIGASAGKKFGTSMQGPIAAAGTKVSHSLGQRLEAGAVTAGAGFGRRFGLKVNETVADYGKQIAATAVGFFAFEKASEFLHGIVEQGQSATKSLALTNAVIKSTGGVANVTADDVENLATRLSNMAGIDDDTVRSTENLLLTFRGVRDEVGKGNDIFDRATLGIVNLAAAMHTDLQSAAKQVGRALNDPSVGLTALTRSGVSFTSHQKSVISSLQASGHLLGAQKIILGELSREFGGAAAAQATWADKAHARFQNLEEQIGLKLQPALEDLARWFATDGIAGLQAFGAGLDRDVISPLGVLAHTVGDVLTALDGLPSPLKSSAVEVGLLALGMKLFLDLGAASAFKAVGAAVTDLGVRTSVTAELQSAGVLSMRTYAASAATAAKSLATSKAGALGLAVGLQVLDGAVGDSSLALHGFLTVASDAAIGFSVGGPWEAAVGGAIGLLQTFAGANHGATQDVEGLTATLNKQTGALTQNSRQWAAKQVIDAGAVDAANTLGLSSRDLTSALLDQGNTADQLRAKLDAIVEAHTSYLAAGNATTRVTDEFGQSAHVVLGLLDDTGGTLAKSRAEWQFTRDAEKGAAAGSDQVAGSMRDQAGAVDAAAAALAGYDKQANAFFGREIGLHQAILDATVAMRKQKDGFDLNTKAGLLNRGVLKTLSDSTQGFTVQTERGRKAIDLAAENIIRFAHAQGASIPQAEQYAKRLLDIDNKAIDIGKNGNPHVHVTADTADANSKLDNLIARLNGLVAHDFRITVGELFTSSGPPPSQPKHKALGGTITGGVPGRDSVHILATPGEEVINVRAAQRHRALLKRINADRFADGGTVGGASSTSSSGGGRIRLVLDFGAGRTIDAWIDDRIDAQQAFAGTTGRQG